MQLGQVQPKFPVEVKRCFPLVDHIWMRMKMFINSNKYYIANADKKRQIPIYVLADFLHCI